MNVLDTWREAGPPYRFTFIGGFSFGNLLPKICLQNQQMNLGFWRIFDAWKAWPIGRP
jgi:hypothetical protein